MVLPDAKFENGQLQAESAVSANSKIEQKRTELVPVYKGGSVPIFMTREALDNLKVEKLESC